MVQCVKLGKQAEGMRYKPFDNELGKRIYENISQEAWKLWLEHSKMIVNEYRVDLASPKGQAIMLEEAEKYFFGEGAQLPPDFQPPASK